jgi:hypothetical protein
MLRESIASVYCYRIDISNFSRRSTAMTKRKDTSVSPYDGTSPEELRQGPLPEASAFFAELRLDGGPEETADVNRDIRTVEAAQRVLRGMGKSFVARGYIMEGQSILRSLQILSDELARPKHAKRPRHTKHARPRAAAVPKT